MIKKYFILFTYPIYIFAIVKAFKFCLRAVLKGILFFIIFIVLYFITALVCGKITVNANQNEEDKLHSLYLSTNGVHTDIIFPIQLLDSSDLKNIYYLPSENYLAMGWGDKNFYINTPEWADLTVKNAFTAMFWKSATLMHVTRYQHKGKAWKELRISQKQFNKIKTLAFADFKLDENQGYQRLIGESYGLNDNFYEALGSYHCFKTCNTWTNNLLKNSGLPAALWTPFDKAVMENRR